MIAVAHGPPGRARAAGEMLRRLRELRDGDDRAALPRDRARVQPMAGPGIVETGR